MEPRFEKVPQLYDQSFYVNDMIRKYFPSPLHFHPEVEILYVLKGFGTRMVGDSVAHFAPGDLVMIGPDTPHVWFSDPVFYQPNNQLKIRTIYIQFSESIFEHAFGGLAELSHIRKLIQRSGRGIRFPVHQHKDIVSMMEKIACAKGFERLNLLLSILHAMAASKHASYLSQPREKDLLNTKDCERINKVYGYVMQNFAEDISLEDVAGKASMAVQSFCRYFKTHTNKTFTTFLNEIRISHACNLLKNDNLPVMDVCYASGYHHFSHFCSKFKAVTGYTPLQYRKRYYG